MELFMHFASFFLHLDRHLTALVQNYGSWSYLILFLIVFCETGLVVTPFLPGDSLLFAAGALAATASFDPWLLWGVLLVAAFLGNTVNYAIGYWLGEYLMDGKIKLIRKDYLERTEKFFAKHGGKAVILSRFIPIIRTFAPFLAGVGEMHYFKYAIYNFVGALAWVTLFVWGGYFFGNLPEIKHNFMYVILGIIAVSFVPVVWEAIQHRRK